MSDIDPEAERQFRDQELVAQAVRSRIEPVAREYNRALSSIWLANGAASLAMLSFIGAASANRQLVHRVLCPLTFFVLALISMGIGTACYLFSEGRTIASMEQADSILGLPAGRGLRPSQKAGLALTDPRSWSAIVSAILFVLGCSIGLIQLWAIR